MIFPSRSISRLFDFSKYLSIVFILTRFNLGLSNFRKSLTFGYPFTFFIVVRKKFNSSSVISFAGLGFFFVNFLDLIKRYVNYHFKNLCANKNVYIHEFRMYSTTTKKDALMLAMETIFFGCC